MKLRKAFWPLFIAAAVLICFFALPGTIQAADADYLTFTLNETGDGYIVSKCSAFASDELSIPATYEGLPVVAIGREAFLNCSKLTGITIPNSVKTIGWYAFSGCAKLSTVTIPDSVTSIDWFAFYRCTGLTQVTVGNGVTVIDAAVFAGCTNLTDVTLSQSVGTIGWSAFKDCVSLRKITIPQGVTLIDRYAFFGCTELSSVAIPGSVTQIEEGAFGLCENLSTLIYCGTEEAWNAMPKGEENDTLTAATLQLHNHENFVCTLCGHALNFLVGDVDGDGTVSMDDAVYLLLHTMFSEDNYPLYAPGDIDRSGVIEEEDAVYLLLYVMFGEAYYPLTAANA